MTLDEVAERFQNCRPKGKGFKGLCPVHGDNKPSVDIDPGDNGGVLVLCRVGCRTEDVLAGVGLTMADLTPTNGKPAKKTASKLSIVATYDYRDESGVLLFQAVRYEPKDFLQRSPKPSGGWNWSTKGVRKVLYRLPELMAADPAVLVFICEGEKDVDRLRSMGLVATCNVGGASKSKEKSKWLPEYSECLKGRNIVVMVDNDEAGDVHSRSVVTISHGTTASEKLLYLPGLPPSGDVSDWLDAGGTKEELLRLVEMTAEFNPAAREPGDEDDTARGYDENEAPFEESQAGPKPKGTADGKRPAGQARASVRLWEPKLLTSQEFNAGDYRQEYIVNKVLVRGQPFVVGGPSKTLKTSLLVDLALSVGLPGQSFLGHFPVCRPGRVWLMSGESGEYTLQETMRRVAKSKDVDPGEAQVFWDFDLPSISSRLDLELLRKIIIDRGINLAMIDPLFLCLIAGSATPIQTSNVFQMGPLLRELSYIGQETGCTMGICHHTTKRLERPGEAPTLEDLSMAGIAEWARQWCLGGRRTRYEEGSGRHDLWLRVGGSAGHSGLYAVDVDEGVLAEDFSGRKWDVTVTSAKDAKLQLDQQKEAVKTQREQEKLSTDMLAVMTVLDALSDGRGETVRELRKVTGNSQARAQAAVDQLLDQGVLEECEVKKANRKKPHPAVRKKPKEDGSDGN